MSSTAAQDKLFDEICAQNQNYEHYEKMFQEVLLDLENDDVLETFRREYETLHNSFQKCHEGERRLIKKCTDLSAEINSCILKVRSADELSGADKNTIDQLKREISKAKQRVAQSKETEITLKEKIKQLKVDIKELDKQVQRGVEGVGGHDVTLLELTRVRADLQKEHETQSSQVLAIQHDVAQLEQRLVKTQDQKSSLERELNALRNAIDLKNNELDAQRMRKERKEKELKTLKEDLAKHNKQVLENQTSIGLAASDIEKLEKIVAATKEEMDRVCNELLALDKDSKRTNEEYEECEKYNEQLKKQESVLMSQLRIKENEVTAIRRDRMRQDQVVQAINRRNDVLDTERKVIQGERDLMLAEKEQLELDISSLAKQAENDQKQMEDLTRERDILNKNYLKAQSATQRQKDWLVVKENQRRNFEHQIRGFEVHAQKQQEIIHQLTKEAEAYEKDALGAHRQCQQTLEEVRTQENVIVDEQKSILDKEAKLKQQQTLLETVLNERNLYTKNLQQLHSEISEMKRKFKIMLGQIKQHKDEIQHKEIQLSKERAAVEAATQQKKKYEIQIDNCKKKTERKERIVEAYNKELHKLNQIIADADAEKARQRRDHVNVMNERDIIGTQLIRRNDELARLYEKIRIQQSELRKGETQYGALLRNMQQLNLRVQQLRGELGAMRAFASRLPDLKLLMNKATRELTRERCRVRQLLDECDNPLNLHRWRLLEGSEPQTAAMIGDVHVMQKELIDRSNEVEKKDRLIAEKEKLYVELKAIIARQPGPEVAEQLNVYQDNLQKKVGQLKAMKASLKHFQEQVEHYKYQYDELQQEMKEMNTKYIASTKKSRKETERRRVLNEMMGRPADAPVEEQEEVYVGYTAPPRPQSEEGRPASMPDYADQSYQPPAEDAPAAAVEHFVDELPQEAREVEEQEPPPAATEEGPPAYEDEAEASPSQPPPDPPEE